MPKYEGHDKILKSRSWRNYFRNKLFIIVLHEIVIWQNVTSDPASKASCSGQRCTMWGSTLSSGGSPASMPCCAFSSRVSPHANCTRNYWYIEGTNPCLYMMIEDIFLNNIFFKIWEALASTLRFDIHRVLQTGNHSSTCFCFITTRSLQVPAMLQLIIWEIRFEKSKSSLQGAMQGWVDALLSFRNLLILHRAFLLQHKGQLLPLPSWLWGLRVGSDFWIQSPQFDRRTECGVRFHFDGRSLMSGLVADGMWCRLLKNTRYAVPSGNSV